MRQKKRNPDFNFLILVLVLLFFPFFAFAHPGGVDDSGCHVCRTNCDKYNIPFNEKHCHNSSAAPTPAPAPPPNPPPSTTPTPTPASAPPPTPILPPAPTVVPNPVPIAPAAQTPSLTPPPSPIPVPIQSTAPIPASTKILPKQVNPPPEATPDASIEDAVIENQTALAADPTFFSKSSTMWLLLAIGIGLLAALGFIASKRI